MKHIVLLSGGHSSAIAAIEVARKFGIENTVLLNHNIKHGIEDKDVKRFKQEISDYLGIPITYANHSEWDTKDPIDVCLDAGTWVNPSTRTILCTHRLKTKPFYDWMAANHQPGDICYYGLDADEMTRIIRRATKMAAMGYAVDFPLLTFLERTITKTMQVGIAPPSQYGIFNHGNCMGCLKAGWQHWYIIYCHIRWLWDKAKAAEKTMGYSIHADCYLIDKEPMFELMSAAKIPATEKIPSAKFWATVKRALRGKQISIFDIPDYEHSVECIGDCGIDRVAAPARLSQ